jgi:hypothetical protein
VTEQRKVPAYDKTGTLQSTSDDQEASNQMLAQDISDGLTQANDAPVGYASAAPEFLNGGAAA